MGEYFLIAFLILFALAGFGLGVPAWAVALTALVAGILKLVGR